MTIETKLEIIDQLAIRVRISFLAVRHKSVLLFNFPKNRLSQPPLIPISSDNRRSTIFMFFTQQN